MKAVGALAMLAWLFIGCGAGVSDAGSRANGTSDAAIVVPQRGAIEDGGVPGDGPSDAGSTDHQPLPPSDFTQGPTVWVGQSDKTVTFPPGYDGGPVGTYNGDVTRPEKVVLILDAATNPLIGTITFGDVGPPPPATDPNQPYPPAPTMLQEPNGTSPLGPTAWLNNPFPGFSYSLVASTLSGNLLHLAFALSQLWQGWCAIQDSSTADPSAGNEPPMDPFPFRPCACDGGACTAQSSPVRQLTLTVSGDTMQGQLLEPLGGGFGLSGGPPQIRLQRVQ
jgi:hypothetical protein